MHYYRIEDMAEVLNVSGVVLYDDTNTPLPIPAFSGRHTFDNCPISAVRQDFLSTAGKCSPSVVVLDQVESLCRKRPEAAGITELQVKYIQEDVTRTKFKPSYLCIYS